MASQASLILQDLVQALRQSRLFASVSLGASGDTSVPRACVIHESLVHFPADDSPSRWTRLAATVFIHLRDDAESAATLRGADLADQAARCLLVDPYRSQLCQDLPIGRATEIGPSHSVSQVRRPDAQMRLDVRCHFEEQAP